MVRGMLDVALKEWSIVCDLLLEGRLALLLRKGGIHEDEGPGVFRLAHPRFALFPAWEHQKPHMIKPAYRERVEVLEEPAAIPIRGLGEAVKIWEVPGRGAFDALDDLHPWSGEQIDMRFNYKPDHPLYLVAIRAARLREAATVANTWEYGGCKSWVPLKGEDVIDDSGAEPSLSDEAFGGIVRRVEKAFGVARAERE